MARLTREEVIKRAKAIHGDKYDYSDFQYVTWKHKGTIRCPIHGEFEQAMKKHIERSRGCPKCRPLNATTPLHVFIKKSNKAHNNKFDYSKVKYRVLDDKVTIICPVHGEYQQKADTHMRGADCRQCFEDRQRDTVSLNTEEFIRRSIDKYGDKFTYDKTKYTGYNCDLIITCSHHGDVVITPANHLKPRHKTGCPLCSAMSQYEFEIIDYLLKQHFTFIKEHTFPDCKGDFRVLRFDFYLPDYNLCIEFDGPQHGKSIEGLGGAKDYQRRKKYDQIKNDYCQSNNINLLRLTPDTNYLQILHNHIKGLTH